MFIRCKKTQNRTTAVQIVESIRVNGKITQKVIRHIGTAANENEINNFKTAAKIIIANLKSSIPPELEEINVNLNTFFKEKVITTGIHDIYGTIFDEVGFNYVLKNKNYNDILRNVVMARIANPDSKKATSEQLETKFNVNIPLKKIYRMMDRLNDQVIDDIQTLSLQHTNKLCNEKISVMFYDATTLYFESFIQDELKQYGYSKDHKFNQSQVLLALFVTTKGLPIGYEVFPGAFYEGHTLITVLNRLSKHFALDNIVFVADRGLFNKENLDFLEEKNIFYIVGGRIKNLSKQQKSDILSFKESIKEKTASHFTLNLNDERKLIVSYNAHRASKDRFDRERSITSLKKRLLKSDKSENLISNYGFKKYIAVIDDSKIELNTNKINEDEKWDGLQGIVSNVTWLTNDEITSHYKGLWQIEESFRISKHDLRIRPIYHWVERRIKAHLAISYMAFCCVRYLEYIIAKKYLKLSCEKIKDNLLDVQNIIIKDRKSKLRYLMPSNLSEENTKIYSIVGKAYKSNIQPLV